MAFNKMSKREQDRWLNKRDDFGKKKKKIKTNSELDYTVTLTTSGDIGGEDAMTWAISTTANIEPEPPKPTAYDIEWQGLRYRILEQTRNMMMASRFYFEVDGVQQEVYIPFLTYLGMIGAPSDKALTFGPGPLSPWSSTWLLDEEGKYFYDPAVREQAETAKLHEPNFLEDLKEA